MFPGGVIIFNRYIIFVLTAFVIIPTLTKPVYGAVKYKDVPETYWAFKAINDVSDRGLIVGDASGNFRPGDPIDKFETSRILAKAMGYKYTGVTDEERSFYKKAYDRNKSIIIQYAKPYVKWKSAYDYEIAYLLEKEILTVEDLSQFLIKDANGVQQYRALSRQEAAVYLVKLMGYKSDALAGDYSINLADDADIKKAYKPYVYYLFKTGILKKDENGKFRPNDYVTRASISVMLSDSFHYIEQTIENTTQDIPVSESPDSPAATQITSLTGKISKFIPDSDSIQITSDSGSSIHKLASGVNIYIDSFLKTRVDLKIGMPVKAVLSNNQIIDLQASGLSLNSSVLPVSNRQYSTLEGIIKDVRRDNPDVSIDLAFKSPDGKSEDSKTLALDKKCKIMQNNSDISADNLKPGDMVMVDISGAICLGLTLKNLQMELTGILQEIHITPDEQFVILKTDDGVEKILYIAPGAVDVYTLRVGMKVHFIFNNWEIESAEILS